MIIFDMDGTLTLVGDRLKYLQQSPKNWDAFYSACDEDLPNEPILNIALACLRHYDTVVIVTGRRESCRKKTLAWLYKHGLRIPSLNLFMRKDGDCRHDTIVKPELVQGFVDDIDIVFEDRASMVKKWRELGVTCAQVADGEF